MDRKKVFIIIGVSILTLLIILFILYLTKSSIYDSLNKRNNLIKLVNLYLEKGEYDRALDKIEELLLKYPNDEEILALQDKILEAKNSKKSDDELQDKLEREKLLESMTSMIDKTNQEPIIIKREEIKEDNSLSSKEKEKQDKINRLIIEGINDFNNQKYAQAKDKFLKALELDSDNAEANAYLGMTLYNENPNDKKNVEEAIKKIKNGLRKNNNIEPAHLTLAEIYDEQGLLDLAIDEYKEALKLNPNNYEAFYNLGRIYYKQNDYANAEINFTNAIKIKPDYVNANFYLANTKYNLKKFSESKTYYKKVLNYDPKFYQASSNLAKVYWEENDYANSLLFYQNAMKLSNKYIDHLNIGDCYGKLKQPEKAIESYLTSISLNPQSSDKDLSNALVTYENIAEIEKNRGKYNESLKYVEKGMKINKSYILYYISAFSKSKLGNNNDAINDYLKALELNPRDIESYINLGSLYNEINEYEKSVNISQKGLTFDNTQYRLYNNLGDSLQKLKIFDQAITAYKKSIDLNSSSSTTYFNLGACYKETDDKESALKAFQQAVNTDKKYQDAYYELGEMYFSLEKYKEAKTVFNILLNENPSYSKRDKIDKMLSVIGNL